MNDDPLLIGQKISLTVEEARKLTGIGSSTLREAIDEGDLTARLNGRHILITRRELEEWVFRLPVRPAGTGQGKNT